MKSISVSQEIWDMFSPVEGENVVYYGKVRNGKTRTATADILNLLERGEIVYANWFIDFQGFDERTSLGIIFSKFFRGRNKYFNFSYENFHFMSPDDLITGKGDINIEFLSRLVGVHIYIDEGQWVLPSLDRSYDDETVAKMRLVLHGGHYCRSLNIITQRPSNLTKTTRSQINVWYRCVKVWSGFGWILFKKYAIEDMKDDLPIEFEYLPPRIDVGFFQSSERVIPLGSMTRYWANINNDRVFKAYDTHAMRGEDAIEVFPLFEVYEVSGRWGSLMLFFSVLFSSWRGGRGEATKEAAPAADESRDEVLLHSTLGHVSRADFRAVLSPLSDVRRKLVVKDESSI